MTSIVKFEVLSGATENEPPCYLLKIDDFTFMLDCGWSSLTMTAVGEQYRKRLQRECPTIDAVLVSQPDVLHCGGLAFAVANGLRCRVFATEPVYLLGPMFMYDFHKACTDENEMLPFTLDDIDTAFDRLTKVKYNQAVALDGKGRGLRVVATCSGRLIGGSVWKVVKDNDEEMYYAPSVNHRKEKLFKCWEFSKVEAPYLFITSCKQLLPDKFSMKRQHELNELLMNEITDTICPPQVNENTAPNKGGNVLIASDTCGRSLELLYSLDELWRQKNFGRAYHLVYLNHTAPTTVELAQASLVEWLSETAVEKFQDSRVNPFALKNVLVRSSLLELNQLVGPKVVVCSMADMNRGVSRQIFMQWARHPSNTVILTERSTTGTLAKRLADEPNISQIVLHMKHVVPLVGRELDEYWKTTEAAKAAAEAAKKAQETKLQKSTSISEAVDSDVSGDDDDAVSVSSSDSGNAATLKDDATDRASVASRAVSSAQSAQASYRPMFSRSLRFDRFGMVNGALLQNRYRDLSFPTDPTQQQAFTRLLARMQQDFAAADQTTVLPPFKQLRRGGQPLFYHSDTRIKWDNYGEVIDPAMFQVSTTASMLSRLQELRSSNRERPAAFPHLAKNRKRKYPMEFEDGARSPRRRNFSDDEGSEVKPTKIVSSTHAVDVQCRLVFINYEARTDGVSLKNIFEDMKPQQVILIQSAEDVSEDDFVGRQVHLPSKQKPIDVTTQSHIYQLRLTDDLVTKLPLQTVGNYNLSWVVGKIRKVSAVDDAERQVPTLHADDDEQEVESRKTISLKQQTAFVNVPHRPKLSDFKQILRKNSFSDAEFKSGVLMCRKGTIAVRHTGVGSFDIEAPLCEDYFKIRKLLYSQFAHLG